jgi:hypothetical protein
MTPHLYLHTTGRRTDWQATAHRFTASSGAKVAIAPYAPGFNRGYSNTSQVSPRPAGFVGVQPMPACQVGRRGECEGSPLAINHFSYLKAEQTDRDAQPAEAP